MFVYFNSSRPFIQFRKCVFLSVAFVSLFYVVKSVLVFVGFVNFFEEMEIDTNMGGFAYLLIFVILNFVIYGKAFNVTGWVLQLKLAGKISLERVN